MTYSSFDYLFADPYYVDGVGFIKAITLNDIRRVRYDVFQLYLTCLIVNKEQCIENSDLSDKLKSLPIDVYNQIELYDLLVANNLLVLASMINFFIDNYAFFDEKTQQFFIYEDADKTKELGTINRNNYAMFSNAVLKSLGIDKQVEKPPKYKSERARQLAEKIEKHKQDSIKESTDDSLDNLILKYCTFNKVGINLLNVGNLTYRGFISLYKELTYSKVMDVQDLVYANTVSFSDLNSYNSELWHKNIQ